MRLCTTLHLFGRQSMEMSKLYSNPSLGLILKRVSCARLRYSVFPSNNAISSRMMNLNLLLCYKSMFAIFPFLITLWKTNIYKQLLAHSKADCSSCGLQMFAVLLNASSSNHQQLWSDRTLAWPKLWLSQGHLFLCFFRK